MAIDSAKVYFSGKPEDLPPAVFFHNVNTSYKVNASNRIEYSVGRQFLFEASAYDTNGIRQGIAEFVIYEDGKPITNPKYYRAASKYYNDSNARSLGIVVEKDKEGVHEYYAKVTDRGGNVSTTSVKKVRFSGKFRDLKPTVKVWCHEGGRVGKAATIMFSAEDFGDDPGIVKLLR